MTAIANGSRWQWLAAAVARPLRRPRLRHQHESLDATALRDLGLSRSELGSFQAEAVGTAARTRRRVYAGALEPGLMSWHEEVSNSDRGDSQ
jgi:uncharacterized protein YjiS (DUF1127 family)